MTTQRFEATCTKCGETQEIALEAESPSHVIEAAIRADERAKLHKEHGGTIANAPGWRAWRDGICAALGIEPTWGWTAVDRVTFLDADAKREERARIVKWLRDMTRKVTKDMAHTLASAADDIERGDHER